MISVHELTISRMLILIFSILSLSILASTCTIGPRASYPCHPHLPYPVPYYPIQPPIPHNAIPSVVIIPATRSPIFTPFAHESFIPTITMNTTVVVEEEQSLVIVTTDIVNTTTVTVSITPGAAQSQSSAWWNNCGSFCGNIPNTTNWSYDMTAMSQKYWYMFGVTEAICLLMIIVI